MEQSFGCAFGDGDSRNTSFRLWREECGKEDAETITVYLWTTNLYEKYAPYIQEQLPDINVEFVVGNNNLDFYSISVEIKETEDGYTLSKVIKKGKQIQDEDTFTVICLAIPKHMKTYPAEHEDPEKNYLEEIQVHEQQEWDSEYVHLKTEEKRWFHNIAICCEINGKKIYGFLSKPIVIEELIGILQHNLV